MMTVTTSPVSVTEDLPLPDDMPALEAVRAYLRENGFDEKNYDEPRGHVSFLGMNFTVPNPPARQRAIRQHDLHHVATGYGTDLPGEAEVSAWEIRGGLGPLTLYVRLLVATALVSGFCLAPLRTIRAFREAKKARSLFVQDRPHEELYAMTLGELRDALGVPRRGIARIRGKHSTAPKR